MAGGAGKLMSTFSGLAGMGKNSHSGDDEDDDDDYSQFNETQANDPDYGIDNYPEGKK